MIRPVDRISVAVLGASGYIGLELAMRLAYHPLITLSFISSEKNAGVHPHLLFPSLRRHETFRQLKFQRIEELSEVDLTFSSLPTGVLPGIIADILKKSKCLINLSGDFRLENLSNIEKFYPCSRKIEVDFAKKYVVPEWDDCTDAVVMSTPGCMAAATLYAIYPLAKAGILCDEIIVDAKTGSSGGGSKNSDTHSVRAGNVKTHKMIGHKHGAEIEEFLKNISSSKIKAHMTTTSLDISRGVLVHIHGNLTCKVEENNLQRLYREEYRECDFIHVTAYKTGTEKWPSVKSVIGTNDCEVGFALDDTGTHFVASATLDNLVKGGAGNAIQLMNKRFGFGLSNGLFSYGVWP